MQEQQKQLVGKLKDAQNVLVTVSKNPSVDQLSAAIGLTIALNKLDKHASAVFSGQVPSTIEFLQPEETLEQNTDSLRDFIIALDKSKADKLRYKVENDVVRIFITPYKTSISEKDLDFSQGDFNVDVVVAIGVREQDDLDEAIQSHGRILHDATVASLGVEGPQELGSINLVDTEASSLCEMVSGIVGDLGDKLFDAQIATALLTGIVAVTDRFSNERTTPKTMNVSSSLMAAGANQKLIASELENELQVTQASQLDNSAPSEAKNEPGTLEIGHENNDSQNGQPPKEETTPPKAPEIHVDEEGKFHPAGLGDSMEQSASEGSKQDSVVKRERMIDPPKNGGRLSANTEEEAEDGSTEELTLPAADLPFLTHDKEPQSSASSVPPSESDLQSILASSDAQYEPQPADQEGKPATQDDETLADIEKSVHSPHVQSDGPGQPGAPADSNIDDARSAVEAALGGGGENSAAQTDTQPADIFAQANVGQADAPQQDAIDPNIQDNALDMPLPNAQATMPQNNMPPQQQQDNTLPPPPPVPPPPIFPA